MRCVIARYPFDLSKAGVETSMANVLPEPVTGECVVIGDRVYPVKQVGVVITRQDPRDYRSLYYLGTWPFEKGGTPKTPAYANPNGFIQVTQQNAAMVEESTAASHSSSSCCALSGGRPACSRS